MTSAEFTAFYPQFAGFTPAVVLDGYIRQANTRFSAFAEEDAEEARRLYTAHKLTMYARAALPDGVLSAPSIVAAPHCGDGSFQVTSESSEQPSQRATILRPTKAQIAAAGQAQQKIASKKVGEVAVTYSSGASSSSVSVSTDLADLTETDFGLQLLSLIRLYSMPVYVP